MTFHAEMAAVCEKTFRASQRLKKIINEKTEQFMVPKNECLVLESLQCVGICAKRIYCPRSSYVCGRKVWLERARSQVMVSSAGRQNGFRR